MALSNNGLLQCRFRHLGLWDEGFIRGPQGAPENTVILTIGTLKMVILVLKNSYMSTANVSHRINGQSNGNENGQGNNQYYLI